MRLELMGFKPNWINAPVITDHALTMYLGPLQQLLYALRCGFCQREQIFQYHIFI